MILILSYSYQFIYLLNFRYFIFILPNIDNILDYIIYKHNSVFKSFKVLILDDQDLIDLLLISLMMLIKNSKSYYKNPINLKCDCNPINHVYEFHQTHK